MGMSDLPDMHAQCSKAYLLGKSEVPMLQVIYITSGTPKITQT